MMIAVVWIGVLVLELVLLELGGRAEDRARAAEIAAAVDAAVDAAENAARATWAAAGDAAWKDR